MVYAVCILTKLFNTLSLGDEYICISKLGLFYLDSGLRSHRLQAITQYDDKNFPIFVHEKYHIMDVKSF